MQTINILLVDDDPGHRYLFGRLIADERPFIRVTFAEDVAAFRHLITENRFHCAIIDFRMSDECDAGDLVAELRTVQPECPSIVVSGLDDQQIAVRSFRAGAADFIHKGEATERDLLWMRIMKVIRRQKRDVAERRQRQRRERRLREMAKTDALTGLANRRAIDSLFGDAGRQTLDRRADSSVIMVDIDHFKRINDTYGHVVGDRILCEFSALMRRYVGHQDVVARWGGEEFLVIRPRTGLVEAVRWAEKLRLEIEASIHCNPQRDDNVTASFGVFSTKSMKLDFDSIQRADEALYQAKRRGRNRVCLWELCNFETAIPEGNGAAEVKLDQSLEQLLPTLGPTQREHLTVHSSSVSTAAMLVGMNSDLDEDGVDALRVAGLCHDIGKVAIPEAVLSKPGPLDESERFLMDMHTDDGAYLSERLGTSPRVTAMVRDSHLRFDDPARRPCDPAASMLVVADAYVAMTSKRPYQRTYTPNEALDELRRESGRQFDPRAVRACVSSLST